MLRNINFSNIEQLGDVMLAALALLAPIVALMVFAST